MISKHHQLYSLILLIALMSCSSEEPPNMPDLPEPTKRTFQMGFTTWPYGANIAEVDDTYSFLNDNGDIYTEHIDNNIPWSAYINNTDLPLAFTNEIAFKTSKRLTNKDLLLSVSVLNLSRNNIVEDLDGTIPEYESLSDQHIADSYYKHITYLIGEFNPKYLVISIEANELYINARSSWNDYKIMIQAVTDRVKADNPNLEISESMTLHNLFQPDIDDIDSYVGEMTEYMNQMDFVSISNYPFFKNQQSKNEYQEAFDFLHQRINRPIAFVETSHLAQDLIVPNLNLNIAGSESQQNVYLETLLENATEQNYKFIIWWAHRDYDALWQTFPLEVRDIGQLWRDTGLLDETGNRRSAMETWISYWGM